MKASYLIFALVLLSTLVWTIVGCSGNSPPQITDLSAQPTTVARGEVSASSCTATDPDGDTLTYSWISTGGSISGTGSSVTWTAPSTLGIYTVTVTVSDGKGGTVARSVSITVANRNPQISSLTTSPATVVIGGNSTVQCTASDPDGDALTYSWISTGGSISGTGSTVAWTAPSTLGIYTVTVTVSDGKGGTAADNVSIIVTNRNPQISSLTASPATVVIGGNSTVLCTASDPDGDALTYSWMYAGGSISGTGSAVTWTAPSTLGIYTVTVTVSDGKGGTAADNVSIIVTNRNPQISSLTTSPATVVIGGSSTVKCTASDPDGDALTYSWMYAGGSISGTGSTITWKAPSTLGIYTVTVTVSDGKGGAVTRNVTITVTTQNP